MKIKNVKYHYFYKITNNLNGHFYYGVHNTNNLDDGYMGSGTKLQYAYKKYGIENFTKEILKYFDSADEAFEYESEIVNEDLIKSNKCYNIQLGGKSINTLGLSVVIDNNGNKFLLPSDDIKIKNKEVEIYSPLKNNIVVKRKNTEKYFLIEKDKYNKNIYDTHWNNRSHTEKSKNKIREAMTPKDSKNTHIWVNKDGIVKYLDKRKLDEYLNNGWNLGRTGYKPRKNCRGKKIEI